jgi:hypothetical protein
MRFIFKINNNFFDETVLCDSNFRVNNNIIITEDKLKNFFNVDEIEYIKIVDNTDKKFYISKEKNINIHINELFIYPNINIININDKYKNLYDYNRDIPFSYLKKFEEYEKINYEKLNFNNMEKDMVNKSLKNALFNYLLPIDVFTLKYIKLMLIDLLLNQSLSFKCLITDKIIRTNKSFHFIVENTDGTYDDLNVYIYDNIEHPFLLVMGNGSRNMVLHTQIHFIYYFNRNQVYNLKNLGVWKISLNDLCIKILQYYKYNYNNLNKTMTAITFCYSSNMAHTYWNDLSGLFFLINMELLNFVDKIILGPYDYYNIFDYLKKNKYHNIVKSNIIDINNITKDYLLFKFNDWFMYNELSTFVFENNIYNQDNEKIIEIKNNFYPIITFNIRAIFRYLTNQEDAYINIINLLTTIYPKLFVIFDGFIFNENAEIDNTTSEGIIYKLEEMKSSYNNIVSNIISKINTKNYISLIGCKLDKQIAWLNISNYGIMQMGAGAFNYAWLMNKKCLFIGRNNYVNNSLLIHTYHDFIFRQNRDFTTYINPKYITFNSNSSFYIEWEKIFFYIIRDIIILEKNNFNCSQYENFQKYNIYQDWGLTNLKIENLNIDDLEKTLKLLKDNLLV